MRLFSCIILTLIAFLLNPIPAHAGNKSCYSDTEAKAEQLIRLHSRLMVEAVTCRKSTHGAPLGTAYGRFTQNNLNAIKDAEKVMLAYYKSNGSSMRGVDRLRTVLANEVGQEVATKGAPLFCATNRDHLVALENVKGDAPVHAEAAKVAGTPLEPSCQKKNIKDTNQPPTTSNVPSIPTQQIAVSAEPTKTQPASQQSSQSTKQEPLQPTKQEVQVAEAKEPS